MSLDSKSFQVVPEAGNGLKTEEGTKGVSVNFEKGQQSAFFKSFQVVPSRSRERVPKSFPSPSLPEGGEEGTAWKENRESSEVVPGGNGNGL